MKFAVVVEVMLRPGIADPQGATVERALPALGFAGVEGVRVGKAIRFTVDAASEWKEGTTPPSFDKQPVRDWLEASGWDKSPPPPTLRTDIVETSRDRYVAAYEHITGRKFADWPGVR